MVCGKGFVGDDLKMSKRSFRFGKQRKKGDRAIFRIQNRLRPRHVAAGAVAFAWPVPRAKQGRSCQCQLPPPSARFSLLCVSSLLLICFLFTDRCLYTHSRYCYSFTFMLICLLFMVTYLLIIVTCSFTYQRLLTHLLMIITYLFTYTYIYTHICMYACVCLLVSV